MKKQMRKLIDAKISHKLYFGILAAGCVLLTILVNLYIFSDMFGNHISLSHGEEMTVIVIAAVYVAANVMFAENYNVWGLAGTLVPPVAGVYLGLSCKENPAAVYAVIAGCIAAVVPAVIVVGIDDYYGDTPREKLPDFLSFAKRFLAVTLALAAVITLIIGAIPPAADTGDYRDTTADSVETESESHSVAYFFELDWETNPVDDFYSRYWLSGSTSSNADMTAFKTARADVWLAELNHAYDLLIASINPENSQEEKEELEQELRGGLEHFLEYADTGAYTEAMTMFSNIFEVYDDYEGFYGGSGMSGCYMQLLGNMYRQETLRVYAMIEDIYQWENVDEAFVFNEEEFLSTVTEKYNIVIEEQ